MKVSLIIPALNEAECLGPLLAEVPAGLVAEVIVVDNGSTDNTGAIARAAGAKVIMEARRGYGFACAAGAAAAQGEALVFMDGDGSFLPAELPLLLAPIEREEADLVLGVRLLKELEARTMPHHQRMGNIFIAWLLSILYGIYLSDLGPYRVIQRELLLALDMQEHTYGWPVEMLVKAVRHGGKVVEVPVSYRPRLAGKSKVGGTLRGSLLSAYRFSRVLFRYTF